MNDPLLIAAMRMQQAGNRAEAARLYSAVLNSNPRNLQALYQLGHLHLSGGGYAAAVRLFEEAAAINPSLADVHFALGCALQQLNRHEEAIRAFGKALALQPAHLGAHINRGNSFLDLARAEDALADFDAVVTEEPRNVTALTNRGVALLELGRHEQALAALDRTLAIEPGHVQALINRGNALRGLDRRQDALAVYDAVLAREPANLDALSNRGVTLMELKRFREALTSFDRALAANPAHRQAWFNRGAALLEMRRTREAIACFDKVLSFDPKTVDAMIGRANALAAERRFDEALVEYGAALAIAPSRADALGNRAAALFELRRYAEAAADAQALIHLAPESPYATGLLLRSRLHCCDWRDLDAQKAKVIAGIEAGKRVIQPFAFLSVCDSPGLQRRCAEIHSGHEYPLQSPLWRGERYAHEKIRVAYVSADFSAHATAHLMAGVFEQHDRRRFETCALSFGRDDGSEMRTRLVRAFDRFIDVTGKTDIETAEIIRDNEIDIAVDLKGYTQEARPGILSFRPAPMQVAYLGYPGTMGAPAIDYILADATVIPNGSEKYYSEKIVRLPDSYQCNDAARQSADLTPTRNAAGLPAEGFVFCCFNNVYKLLPERFDIWMRLLCAVEGSVLWLLDDNATATGNLRREAQSRGVEPSRLRFAPKLAPREHLARHRLADLFLDTFPYGAHTTASDALWMGLPLISYQGQSFAARVPASLLSAAGVPELVTRSLPEYEALALTLARDPVALAALKNKIEMNRSSAALFDTVRFTRQLEAAYTAMWNRSLSGEAPQGFDVPRAEAWI